MSKPMIHSAKWAAVLAIAAAVRLVSWPHAPPGDPAKSPFDGDSHYHRLRAEQIVRDFPRVESRDPDLGDGGIDIPWPPLFDELVASAALVIGDGEPSRTDVAFAAAWAPVVIGVATVPLVGWFGGIVLGSEMALGTALIAALSTPHAMFSLLGRSDQHVLELFLTIAILIAYARGLSSVGTTARAVAALAVGALIALSFWNWPGSALNLLFLAGFVSAWHVLSPQDEPRTTTPARVLATGCGAGAVVLAATVALLGPPGALGRATILGVGGLHVVLTAGTGVFAAVLWCARHLNRNATTGRRAAEVVVAGAVPFLAATVFPGIRSGIGHGLLALFRGNRWYVSIGEFEPILFGRYEPLWREVGQALAWYGLVPVFALLGAVVLRDRWREGGPRCPEVLLLLILGAISFVLALWQYRFGLYAAAPLALWSCLGVRYAQERWVPRLCRGIVLSVAVSIVFISPVLSLAKTYVLASPKVSPGPVLEWVSEKADATAARAVYSRWSWGHHVRALARRPAIANPFGTDGGASAGIEESLRAFLLTDEQQFVRVLRAHDAGYLLNEDPRGDVLYQDMLPTTAPALAQVSYGWRTGLVFVETEYYHKLVSYRLYAHDGSSADGSPALQSFRLLRETEPADGAKSDRPAYTLFGVVPGARLELTGATPGAEIMATTRVRTNTGREFSWRATARADASGLAELRVPYATGENGSSVAEPFEVSSGRVVRRIEIPEGAVNAGHSIAVSLRNPANQ